jgi:hypothetical protein
MERKNRLTNPIKPAVICYVQKKRKGEAILEEGRGK